MCSAWWACGGTQRQTAAFVHCCFANCRKRWTIGNCISISILFDDVARCRVYVPSAESAARGKGAGRRLWRVHSKRQSDGCTTRSTASLSWPCSLSWYAICDCCAQCIIHGRARHSMAFNVVLRAYNNQQSTTGWSFSLACVCSLSLSLSLALIFIIRY